MKLLAAVLLNTCLIIQAMACEPDEASHELIAQTPVSVNGYAVLGPSALSQPFDMQLFFCGEEAEKIERVEVEAIMPAHQHGMNYVPKIEALESGQFSVSGMVFHMPGEWQIQISAFGLETPGYFNIEVDAK